MSEGEYLYDDEPYQPPVAEHAPRTLLDFIEVLAPIAKYYAVLLFFWYLTKRFNAAVEQEADAQERERQRPTLSSELVDGDSSDDDDAKSEEGEIYEELVTNGSRLESVPGGDGVSGVRGRKPKKGGSSKSHPLFEGLKKVEEELRQQREEEKNEANVSWNELHMNMLKRYKQKYPEHGPRVPDGDEYDDEFKELLKKHNVDVEELKKQQ